MHPATKTIQLRSGTHTYCDYGEGEKPIVLVHGLSFQQGLYPLMTCLAPDFRVIALDLPLSDRAGFKRSPTLEAYANLILDFATALALDSPGFFGNSLGGTLGLICALKDPDSFSKLVIRAPLWTRKQLPGYLRIPGLVPVHTILSKCNIYARNILALIYKRSVRMSPTSGNGDQGDPSEDHLALFDSYQINPVLLSSFLGHLLQVKLEGQVSKISTPTLVLWGAQDSLTPSTWGKHLALHLPEGQFMASLSEYHNLATIDHQALASVIRDFLLPGR